MWFSPCPYLLKRYRPASFLWAKTAKPQQRHETTCPDALFHMCLHNIQTSPGGLAGVAWHFPRGLQFVLRNRIIYANTHMQIYSLCVVAYVHLLNVESFEVTKPGGLATNCSRRNRRWAWLVFKGKHTHLTLISQMMWSWTNTESSRAAVD